MSDPTPDPLDDLASAHLDGVADPAEAARAAADPEVRARRATFEEVREAIRAEVAPVSAEAREGAIAAALAAADTEVDADRVVPIGLRRARWARAVGVAAAVVLLAALVPALLDDGGGSDDEVTASGEVERGTTADGALETADDAVTREEADTASPGGGASGRAGDTMAASHALADLGAVPDLATLTAAVRQQLAGPGDAAVPLQVPDGPASACLERATAEAVEAGSVLVLTALASLAGRPVLATVVEDPAGARLLVVADPAADCARVAAEPL